MSRFVVFLMLFVAGCGVSAPRTVDSPWYQPPPGSRWVLNRPVEIPPAAATVRFQDGRPVSAVRPFDIHCVFEVSTVRDVPQRVEPDVFVVTRVRSGSSVFGAALPARLVPVRRVSDDGGTVRYYFMTEMFLRSEKQPQVMLLTCQHAWETGSDFRYERPPTVAEMQKALGDWFTLGLPAI